jgi:hypothetical protein
MTVEYVDEVPDDAMAVEHGHEHSDHENYVKFTVTDVIEWYTVHDDAIKRERFIAENPVCPEDIPIGLDEEAI